MWRDKPRGTYPSTVLCAQPRLSLWALSVLWLAEKATQTDKSLILCLPTSCSQRTIGNKHTPQRQFVTSNYLQHGRCQNVMRVIICISPLSIPRIPPPHLLLLSPCLTLALFSASCSSGFCWTISGFMQVLALSVWRHFISFFNTTSSEFLDHFHSKMNHKKSLPMSNSFYLEFTWKQVCSMTTKFWIVQNFFIFSDHLKQKDIFYSCTSGLNFRCTSLTSTKHIHLHDYVSIKDTLLNWHLMISTAKHCNLRWYRCPNQMIRK